SRRAPPPPELPPPEDPPFAADTGTTTVTNAIINSNARTRLNRFRSNHINSFISIYVIILARE
ncbi:MAG: hypothetical protein WAJ89_00315, partial [Methanoregula sp.]